MARTCGHSAQRVAARRSQGSAIQVGIVRSLRAIATETAAAVPWTGLETTTRAYAKIVDEVNKLPLSALMDR